MTRSDGFGLVWLGVCLEVSGVCDLARITSYTGAIAGDKPVTRSSLNLQLMITSDLKSGAGMVNLSMQKSLMMNHALSVNDIQW